MTFRNTAHYFLCLFFIGILFSSCKDQKETKKELAMATPTLDEKPKQRIISKDFKDYWYSGTAEISSYKLSQARYGEIRDGNAVLVYVTEPFLADKQVKADKNNPSNISVLKLNHSKKFLTGIYPYSIMSSSFYPIKNIGHAIKVSNSVQEWCGHVYMQLNNKEKFNLQGHSYFESEGDQNFSINKSILEDELWTQLRINPEELPVGTHEIIPSLEYARLKHVTLKAYKAVTSIEKGAQNTQYKISYPDLKRDLTITFESNFPYKILSWEESFMSGFGKNAKKLSTKASLIKSIKSAYWGKNSNADLSLRDSLGI